MRSEAPGEGMAPSTALSPPRTPAASPAPPRTPPRPDTPRPAPPALSTPHTPHLREHVQQRGVGTAGVGLRGGLQEVSAAAAWESGAQEARPGRACQRSNAKGKRAQQLALAKQDASAGMAVAAV